MSNTCLDLCLPDWLPGFLASYPDHLLTDEARMALVIALAGRNIEAGTGGPFGAAVFERDSGRLVATGVNRVVACHCSLAHAEMIAIALAQQRLQTHDLSLDLPVHEIVTSCEPCAMCMGAIPWSGVRRMVCGARDEDARRIGFDEGPKALAWQGELERRGIEVITDLQRAQAVEVLADYRHREGVIYGPGRG